MPEYKHGVVEFVAGGITYAAESLRCTVPADLTDDLKTEKESHNSPSLDIYPKNILINFQSFLTWQPEFLAHQL